MELRERMRTWRLAVKETFDRFSAADPFTLAAALSCYALLSLAPLLVVVLAIVGFFWGERAARGELVEQIETFVGPEGAEAVQTVIANAGAPGAGTLPMILGLIVLLIGATTVLAQLQASLNRIWDVQLRTDRSAVANVIRTRVKALGIVLVIGALFLLAMGISAALSGMHGYLNELTWGLGWFWQIVHFVISVALVTVLIAMVFKYLPDVRIAWGDVWVGAAVTALLLVIGQFAIGIYLGQAAVGTPYGAAGAAVVLVVWIYYSALILLLGAQITEVYARRSGQPIVPARHAMPRSHPEPSRKAA